MNTEPLIAEMRDRMVDLLPSERIDLVNDLLDGYCKHCGWADPEGVCQCWNDE